MPRYIIKLSHEGQDYYMEWSTIVDAPATYGMPLDEFRQYYQEEYGRSSLDELERRLVRVESTGTSCRLPGSTVDSLIEGNHAGNDEASLTKQEIIQKFCVDRPDDDEENEQQCVGQSDNRRNITSP